MVLQRLIRPRELRQAEILMLRAAFIHLPSPDQRSMWEDLSTALEDRQDRILQRSMCRRGVQQVGILMPEVQLMHLPSPVQQSMLEDNSAASEDK